MLDLRYAIRGFVARPFFTLACVSTLGLGIGANTAIFSVVYGVLLQPLPLPEAERLMRIHARSAQGFDISVSIQNFFSWEEMATTFESMGAARLASVNLTGRERPERLEALQVLGEYFATLGREPYLGRVLSREETLRGAEPRAVVSYGFWQRALGGSRAAVGQTIRLDGLPFTVIGVMPADFYFPSPTADVWLPMGVYAESLPWDQRGASPGILVVARRKAGLGVEAAIADMEAVGRRVQQDTDFDGVPVTRDLRSAVLGPVGSLVVILFFAVTLVLLIACVNVAGLLLARGEARRREVALRSALGAGRSRIVRQLLTESVLLALAGGVTGVALAYVGFDAFKALLPEGFPLTDRVGLDPAVLGYCLGVSLLTGVFFGLVPAMRASKIDLEEALREGGRGGPGRTGRLRSVLVATEIALALVLLVGSGLLLRSFAALRAVDPGFRTDAILTLRVSLPPQGYEDTGAWSRFFERLLERVEGVHGVVSVAVNNGIPLASGGTESGVIPDSRPFEEDSFASCLYQAVSPDYFRTLSIPLLRGRTFEARDREGRALVAIVDESMARSFWPEENPIGRRVAFEFRGTRASPEPVWREVVGVVGHVRHYELRSRSRVEIYVPFTQPPIWMEDRRPAMALFVKSEGDPTSLLAPIRAELEALDPNLPVYDVRTMDEVVETEMGNDRILSGVLTVFALVALLLAAVGVYGVIAYVVSRRTREIGLRMALGASRRDVIRMVLGRSGWMTAAGLGSGVAVVLALSRFLDRFLFQVSAADPLTFVSLSGAMALVVLAASYIPARRATTIEPVQALRYE